MMIVKEPLKLFTTHFLTKHNKNKADMLSHIGFVFLSYFKEMAFFALSAIL